MSIRGWRSLPARCARLVWFRSAVRAARPNCRSERLLRTEREIPRCRHPAYRPQVHRLGVLLLLPPRWRRCHPVRGHPAGRFPPTRRTPLGVSACPCLGSPGLPLRGSQQRTRSPTITPDLAPLPPGDTSATYTSPFLSSSRTIPKGFTISTTRAPSSAKRALRSCLRTTSCPHPKSSENPAIDKGAEEERRCAATDVTEEERIPLRNADTVEAPAVRAMRRLNNLE